MAARLVVLCSFVLTISVLAWALFATNAMQRQYKVDPFGTAMSVGIGLICCGWPWFLTASTAQFNKTSSAVFSVLSVGIALLFARPIATAPAEGVGWYLIICTLLIWLAYWLTPRSKTGEPPQP